MSRQLAIGRNLPTIGRIPHTSGDKNETVHWDKWTFRLPPVVSPESPLSLKQTFYNVTVLSIDASKAPPSTKSSVLATRFPYAHHINEAENRLRNLLGRTVGHASTIDLTHASFSFRELVLRNSDGVPQAMAFPCESSSAAQR